MTPQDQKKDSTKYFLVRAYYEYIREDLSQEELQSLIALIAEDLDRPEISAE